MARRPGDGGPGPRLDERRRPAPARRVRRARFRGVRGTRTGWRSRSSPSRAEPKWPDGIAVRTFEPDDERKLYEVHTEVWQDTSDPSDESFEEWRTGLTKREGFDPSLWFLAFDRRRARGVLALAVPTTSTRTRATSTCSACAGPGGAGGSARRSCFTRSARSATAGTRAGRSALTRRARPARRGCTSARDAVYRDTVFLDRPARPS